MGVDGMKINTEVSGGPGCMILELKGEARIFPHVDKVTAVISQLDVILRGNL